MSFWNFLKPLEPKSEGDHGGRGGRGMVVVVRMVLLSGTQSLTKGGY